MVSGGASCSGVWNALAVFLACKALSDTAVRGLLFLEGERELRNDAQHVLPVIRFYVT